MENHQRPAKRRREEEAGLIMDDEDRITQLPQHILQNHVLSRLPQDDAVRTCILSKSWRYLGPTRPKIEFDGRFFKGNQRKGLSALDNTLQRYDDQKFPIQELILRMWASCRDSSNNICWLLDKWIVKLHMLKRLELFQVHIDKEETFEKIIGPSIEHLVLDWCSGLSSVKLNKARNLKHLDCEFVEENGSIEINDDAQSLEIIRIKGDCGTWHYLHKNCFLFPRLKSLFLFHVHLPAELLNNLSSNNCPCLEDLELRYCSGFAEFELSNHSIKRLIIIVPDPNCPINAAIDAPNMLYFEFSSGFLPTISFATTWREWKSVIKVWRSSHSKAHVSSSTWSLKLHEFLKALSLSQISLDTYFLPKLTNHQDNISEPRVVVEHLCLRGDYSSYSLPELLNCVFGICRPRYIQLPFYSNSEILCESQHGEYIWKTLKRQRIQDSEIKFLIF